MMKKLPTRLSCLLLSLVMLLSLLPMSAFAADVQEGGGIAIQAAGGPTIPGYNQVTNLKQIKADRKYLIVAQATDGTFYALYLNADGAGKGPGADGHPQCTATLTISGNTVTAVSTASTSTSIAMSNLHVTIAESSTAGKYTIKNTTHGLQLSSTMFTLAGSAPALTLAFTSDGRFAVTGSANSRHLTCNVVGDSKAHYPGTQYHTGFCGWNDPQTNTNYYIPIYLFIEGDLPAEPGMNLANMLSGDQIGGGATAEENPGGQNSWVFTGGRAAQGSFADIKGARSYAGHFEEYVRYTHAKQLQPSGESTTPYFQRHVINAAYTGQKLADIVSSFDTRITPLKPRAISYLVDEGGSSEAGFATNLQSLIGKALALQNGTGMIVIETLTDADKTAVDAVVENFNDAQKPNVLSVKFTLADAQKTNNYPNASGHLEMAKQLANAVAGTTVSSGTNWPYGAITNSALDSNFPNKTTTDPHHTYENAITLNEAQQAIKDKVDDGNTPMTWLFMGDSITHGAAWTGGYDTLAQLFEKFVKDDLDRAQDIVINSGSSGATTASTISDLNRRLVKYSPDVVVLMLGTNDASSNVSEATFKTNIRTILDKITAKGATPVLRTPPPTNRSGYDIATYARYIREITEETKYAGKVILVDQYALWMDNDWSNVFRRGDNLHPDEAGHLWFAHQLIKELALWDDSYSICGLEYVEMEEAEKIELPGYTLLTDIGQLDETKGYLIVSQSDDGNLYAVYPSSDGETLNAGDLPSPGGATDGARTAELTVNGESVSAVWLKTNAAVDMEKLLFTIKRNAETNKYVFTAFTGYHLNMTTKMFTEGEAELTVTSRGTAAPYAFRIQNARRSLDFTKTGDPNAFYNSGQNINTYGTDFWCPNDNIKMNIYLFASDVTAPTAKESVQALMTEIENANLVEGTYTRASWAALQSALTAADGLVKNTGVDNDAQEVKDAWDALRAAYEGLNERPVPPTVPAGAIKIEDWKEEMVPDGGTTQNEPFAYGTGGSSRFRIPAIITLQHQADPEKNGRLLSAIDARWNHTGDACCLDTIVSYSDDTGANWTYTFANYFGDSTDEKALDATAFIDPVLLEDSNGTIYLMVDIWPGGIALNTAPRRPATATGYVDIDGTQRLALYVAAPNASAAAYDYYVGGFEDGYAPVMEPVDGADPFSGYYVDEYYYLYYKNVSTFEEITEKGADADKIYCQRLGSSDWVQQNVFFYNATLHVRDASYLWIVTSKDGGETWGDPVVINGQVRTGEHSFYGVGPGCGLCIETHGEDGAIPNGTLMFPVYVNPNEQAGFIYSMDGGGTWKRSNSYAAASSVAATSESCLVQIDATTVRHFYRESWKRQSTPVAYTDHTWNSTTQSWETSEMKTVAGANHYGACQVSAIKYSEQVDGKDLILYSTPTGGSRASGRIYAFLVSNDEGHTMTLHNTYDVNGSSAYAYSSLTETADGDIALLYESVNDAVIFKVIPITDIVPDLAGLDVTGWTGAYDGTAHTVTVTTNPNTATLQYSTDDGANWSDIKPAFTDAGTYAVKVKATWGETEATQVVKEATATVTINKAAPTLTITTDKDTYTADEYAMFTVSGVPSEGTVTLTCSNTSTENGHNPKIELTKQDDGTWTGTHDVKTGSLTFTAAYAATRNYADATATYRVTVAPAKFGLKATGYTNSYDGEPHSITVTAAEGVTLTYCETESGTYSETKPTYTDAGTYTTYFKAVKNTEEVTGSANVTITKATPPITIECDKEHSGEGHTISTRDLPLTLTIKGVPAEDQGHITLTTFGDAVRNFNRDAETGNWVATPNIPPITRTYTFTAVFDPTVKQDGTSVENQNYERVTEEFVVTISRPDDEEIDFDFDFAEGVDIDEEISTKGTLTVTYDGRDHSPLEALTYDDGLVLSYHIPVTEDAGDDVPADTWITEQPKFRQPGEYTVSVMASPANSSVARVLTVVLVIEEGAEIPVDLTITPNIEATETGEYQLTGGSPVTLTLTVAGMPEAGTLTVTCNSREVILTETERGTYTAMLSGMEGSYHFTAHYSGAGSYQGAEAECWVYVTEEELPEVQALGGTLAITGEAKYGETLLADLSRVTPVDVRDGFGVNYQWKRNGADILGATGLGYVLTEDDIDEMISLVVTGDPLLGYTGALTSTSIGPVEKLAGPDRPSVTKDDCTALTDDDGKITITGYDSASGKTYQIHQKTGDNPETWSPWADATVSPEGVITVEAGTYEIREKVANEAIQETGAVTQVVIYAHGTTTYAITVAAVSNGTVTVTPSGSVAAGATVTITVTPDTGYSLDSLTVAKADGTGTVDTTRVDDTTYTFVMPACAVTVTAGFDQIQGVTYTVTFMLNDGSDTIVMTQTVDEGGTATEPATPTNTGYTFGGWYLDENCAGDAYDFDTVLSGDITLYAKWTENSTPAPTPGPIGGILPPPTTTTVVENPDGSTTTTVTDNRTGTVTETTEKEDGTVETVETKKDGTVTETTENPDGSTEVVETKPDGTVTATATDPEGGKVEKITTPDEDVTITVTDKDGEELAKVEIPAEIPASPIEFVDVPEGHWAESAINQAAGLGLVQGVGDNLFDLNGDMVRGDLALILYNLSNGSEGYEVTFDDVPADAYYAESVAWAVATGVVKGYSETEFGPKDNITREELAVMLYRYAKLLKLDTAASADALDAFNDGSNTSSWAEDGMAWCVENEIIKGKGSDTLDPGANATRAEVTVMLQRFMNLMKK